MIHEIPFPGLFEDLKLYADYTTRQFHNQKAYRIYNKAILRLKYDLASRIMEKYGKAISETCKSDMAMALEMSLMAEQSMKKD